MADRNQILLDGTIAFPPDGIRFVGDKGTAVINFKVHTKETYKGKESTETHKVTAWGSMAEEVGAHAKGDRIIVEGRLQTRSYEDKKKTPPVTVWTTEIVASKVTLTPAVGGTKPPPPAPVNNFGPDPDETIPF